MSEIRILTVRQPWAWAIMHGGKDVENRVRNIAGDYRGTVAIHAALTGASFDGKHADLWPFDKRHVTGAILGTVNLWAVHRDRDNGNCCPHLPVGGPGGSPWSERDVWHLCLNNPRPLRTPIPFKGALGLRKFDDAILSAVQS